MAERQGIEALGIEGLRRAFGGLQVTRDVSFALAPGERAALIGPNGAGKSTFINLVTGHVRPDAGIVRLGGEDVTRASLSGRVRRGLVRSFQVSRLCQDLTFRDHVRLAVLHRQGRSLRPWGRADRDPAVEAEAAAGLADLGLTPVADTKVREAAYGEHRLLELAIALALRPRVLLLDEPAAGVSHAESPRIVEALANLPPDIAVLMVEHDMDLVFRFASRVLVLAGGALIFDGGPDEVVADATVRAAYLGQFAARRGEAGA